MAKGSGGTRSGGASPVNRESMYEHLSGTMLDEALPKEESISLIMDKNHVGYIAAEKYYDALQDFTENNIADNATLEDFIKTAPKWQGDDTYRGMNVSNDFLKKLKIGDTYTQGKISSWTTDRHFAIGHIEEGSNPVLFISRGGQPKGTSIVHASVYPTDSEVLVSKSASYKIENIYTDAGMTVVEVSPKYKK